MQLYSILYSKILGTCIFVILEYFGLIPPGDKRQARTPVRGTHQHVALFYIKSPKSGGSLPSDINESVVGPTILVYPHYKIHPRNLLYFSPCLSPHSFSRIFWRIRDFWGCSFFAATILCLQRAMRKRRRKRQPIAKHKILS